MNQNSLSKYIQIPYKDKNKCIMDEVKHFGIELQIVTSYESAIMELTKQTKKGFCDYYATWVICGPPLPILPNKADNPYLLGQFIDVLIKFWNNGGSLVFLAEGEPLTYQVNIFLQKVKFPGNIKMKLQLNGVHKGNKYLYGDETGKLENNGQFNKQIQTFKNDQRTCVSHNLNKIFEGITISYCNYDDYILKPFIPFSRDSEGGVSSMFYCADSSGNGDIFIDCGFTKFFTQIEEDGTFKYIQNIVGRTAHPEIHVRQGIEPKVFRPKAIRFQIDKNDLWEFNNQSIRFQTNEQSIFPQINLNYLKQLRHIFAIDCSYSVHRNTLYHQELKKIIDEFYHSKDEIYLWGSAMKIVTKEELDLFIKKYGRI